MAADDLVWRSALELAALIRAKQVSPVEVVDAVLARIERLHPALNCEDVHPEIAPYAASIPHDRRPMPALRVIAKDYFILSEDDGDPQS